MEEKIVASKKTKPAKGKKFNFTFFKGVKAEFKKITWPGRTDVVKQTGAVISVSVILGVIIALLDMIFQYGVSFFIG